MANLGLIKKLLSIDLGLNDLKSYCYIGSIYLSIYLILWHLQHLYLTFLTTNDIEPVLQADVVDERPVHPFMVPGLQASLSYYTEYLTPA